ncbi:substrate-binding domain-containing protein [Sinanaerobacter chloroacetimidivorans]|uniref:Substrate-binding domain-containing protein n=1 Tax=Sinanaerobacter chloroacetimidivorans TaxID=2818044 RepID=A0A8J8B1W3_9FIRM|nr:substrate-binding domain-containing protein [Sinanaerobacter chloroacetimidivorans]MBR0598659.1 substrate-binding domain-containing protein [Sinanaerobacter chloroacetimidivorans]
MGVTLKQIAEIAGVSRGTVDRALHGRGRVNPETAKLILNIANELGYRPNRMGRALALTRKSIHIGVIVQSYGTPFMNLVIEGIQKASAELHDVGAVILTEFLESVNPQNTIAAMDRLIDKGAQALALTAVDDDNLREHINFLSEDKNIPIITFNSDILGTKRLCYVGQNSFQSGQTCAYLMSLALRGTGKVFPLTGHLTNVSHQQRFLGFSNVCEQNSGIELLPLQCCFDQDHYAYELTMHALQEYPDLSGIFVTANGQSGACQALIDAKKKSQICLIAYDLTPQNCKLLQDGHIDILIGQGALLQGYQPPILLYNYLINGTKLEQEFLYTDIVIKTKYNL